MIKLSVHNIMLLIDFNAIKIKLLMVKLQNICVNCQFKQFLHTQG